MGFKLTRIDKSHLLEDLNTPDLRRVHQKVRGLANRSKTERIEIYRKLPRDHTGRNPLHYAAIASPQHGLKFVEAIFKGHNSGFTETMEFFSQENSTGEIPLIYAARVADRGLPWPVLFEKLLTLGDPDLLLRRDNRGRGVMHIAAEANNGALIKFLLRHSDQKYRGKVEIAETIPDDEFGDHPAHVAARLGNTDAFIELDEFSRGHAVLAKNKKGRTPIQLAFAHDRKDIMEYIQPWSAKATFASHLRDTLEPNREMQFWKLREKVERPTSEEHAALRAEVKMSVKRKKDALSQKGLWIPERAKNLTLTMEEMNELRWKVSFESRSSSEVSPEGAGQVEEQSLEHLSKQ